jgi:hypothetical protein
MPKIPRIVGWAFILAGVGIYIYEANIPAGGTINPTLAKLESVIPGNLGLDLPLFVAGAAILTLG